MATAGGVAYIYALSLLPFFEGRFALSFGPAVGLTLYESLLIASLGTLTLSILLPVFVGMLDKFLFGLRESRYALLRKVGKLYVGYVRRVERRKKLVERYGLLGLVLFVAIPFPGSGVWSGSLLGLLLRLNRARLSVALLLGGIISNILVFYTIHTFLTLE